MRLFDLNIMLAFAPQPQSGQQYPAWVTMVPMMLLLVVAYFILLRPQQKKQREIAEMLKTVRRGDKVTTTSGILGTVINVNDKSVTIRSADAKLEITKTAIAQILERSGEPSES